MLGKIKNFFKDHYHILFKSAAVNHLRIQEILKSPDGTYNLTVKFGSYSALKNYQRKMRRLTVSLSSAVAMVVVAFVVAPYIMNPSRSSASNFTWTQNAWTSQTSNVKKYPDNNNGVTEYSSKNDKIDVTSGKIAMTVPTVASTGDSSYSTAPDGFYLDGSARVLKKVQGASCASVTECKSGICTNGTCCNDACCGVASVTDSRDTNNPTYNTLLLGNQCWMARNLNVGTMIGSKLADNVTYQNQANNSIVEKYCFNYVKQGDAAQITTGNSNCASYGGLYQWPEANALSASCISTSCAVPSPNQGICPTGWHVPTDAEIKTLEMHFGMAQADADGAGWRGIVSAPFRTGLNILVTAGYFRPSSGDFTNNSGKNTALMTATEYDIINYRMREFNSDLSGIYRSVYSKNAALPLRCVKN
ncbi:MAG: hypothetical protein ACD_56C00148G0004 [uncultured bacterium]|nr:MAG: hypothetical protein ACD_56C00148G0004 [uncultured bacterium]